MLCSCWTIQSAAIVADSRYSHNDGSFGPIYKHELVTSIKQARDDTGGDDTAAGTNSISWVINDLLNNRRAQSQKLKT